MAELIGIEDVTTGPSYSLGGVIAGARGEMYFHKVNLFIEKYQCVEVMAGFCKELAVTGLVGRLGFFNNFIVTFDHSTNPPVLLVEKINRA